MKLLRVGHLCTRSYSTFLNCLSKPVILGIESSCDDTGCAIITGNKEILGESLVSQRDVVLRHGGVMPLVARDLHSYHIENVVNSALHEAKLSINEIDAIAVTVKPGLAMSLEVGLKYAKKLCKAARKPLIPIHHMEAHALTIRLLEDIKFPFLTFLISGGHCLLAVVRSVNQFLLLGQNLHDAPGEVFDKVARRLRVHNIPKYRSCSGGAAVEDLAENGNPLTFEFTAPLTHYKNCNFSFSGMKSRAMKYIASEEKKFDIEPDEMISSANDLCASVQWAITKHLCWRLQRSMEYVEMEELLPKDGRTLVVSGGAACNKYIQKAFKIVCNEMKYKLHVPPLKYCTDNGIMIAWNGIEKYVENIEVVDYREIDDIVVTPKCPLGQDLSVHLEKAAIKCEWIKIHKELHGSRNEQNSCVQSG